MVIKSRFQTTGSITITLGSKLTLLEQYSLRSVFYVVFGAVSVRIWRVIVAY